MNILFWTCVGVAFGVPIFLTLWSDWNHDKGEK